MSRTMKMMTILSHNLKLNLCYPTRYQEKMLICRNVFHQKLPKILGAQHFYCHLRCFKSNCKNSIYNAWKHFIHKSILRIIIKYTNEKAQCKGNTSFFVDLQKWEAFIGLQYAQGIYRKCHPVAFLWSKTYGILIFYETMGAIFFLKF